MSQHANQPQDHSIDRVLTALRDTPAPTGLEARIAHRLLQAQALASTPQPSPLFAFVLGYARAPRIALTVATALAVALAIPLSRLHHEQPAVATQATTSTATNRPATALAFRPEPDGRIIARRGEARSSSATTASTTPDDPDAVALAETLAPSHPIPPLPLTAEERLLFSATRPGQPIELAQLELAREPNLRAAAVAREHTSFVQIARSLLAPLAAAEALEPTTDTTTESPR